MKENTRKSSGKEFGERLKFIMDRDGLTVRELSMRTGISAAAIENYRRGKTYEPRLSQIVCLADTLGVSIDYLLGRLPEDTENPAVNFQSLQCAILERDLQSHPLPIERIRRTMNIIGECIPPYPYNLIADIFAYDADKAPSGMFFPVSDDQKNGLESALSELTEREQTAVAALYKEGKSANFVGKEYGVTGERIRQIQCKAIRKLRHPSRKSRIRYGLRGCAVKTRAEHLKTAEAILDRREKELQQKDSRCAADLPAQADISISEMSMSNRSRTCLQRAGIVTLSELIRVWSEYGADGLARIRNLGKKSALDVNRAVEAAAGTPLFEMPTKGKEAAF